MNVGAGKTASLHRRAAEVTAALTVAGIELLRRDILDECSEFRGWHASGHSNIDALCDLALSALASPPGTPVAIQALGRISLMKYSNGGGNPDGDGVLCGKDAVHDFLNEPEVLAVLQANGSAPIHIPATDEAKNERIRQLSRRIGESYEKSHASPVGEKERERLADRLEQRAKKAAMYAYASVSVDHAELPTILAALRQAPRPAGSEG